MPTVNRSYVPVERQWLAEYLQLRHPTITPQFERKLHYENPSAIARGPGGSPTGQEGRAIARLDAWVPTPAAIEVWEASQWFHMGKFAQLVHYRDLLPATWEGKTQIHGPVTWHALTSHARREVLQACENAGIEYVVYLPQWLAAHQVEQQQLGENRRLQFAARTSTTE